MRRTFADALLIEAKKNPKIVLLTGDLGYGMWDQFRNELPEQFINTGAAEQALLDISCGLALEGMIPFVYTITPFYLRAFETLRTYINHENIVVHMVGSGRDKDYAHDGFSHDASDIREFLDPLKNIQQFYPETKESIPELVAKLIESKNPTFISLKRWKEPMALSALFYPNGTPEKPIKFDELFIPYIYNEIYFDGVYLDVVNMLQHTKTDPVIVDVGANIGVVTQYLRQYGKVYAVEPSKEHFEALAKNKEFNHWDNVELFNYAIADKEGEMEFHHNEDNLTCNSLVMGFKNEHADRVKTKGMMDFFKEAGITHVDFMKFDVEGGEELILPSDQFAEAMQMVDCIEVAFHLPDFTKHLNRMREVGFKTARRYQCAEILFNFSK